MGAWRYLHGRFGKTLLGRFPFSLVSRVESASPATGSAHAHKLEQGRLVAQAFGDDEPGEAGMLEAKRNGASTEGLKRSELELPGRKEK